MNKVTEVPEKANDSSCTPMLPPPPAHPSIPGLGISSPCSEPTDETPLDELLLYGLTPHGGDRPELGIVLVVMNELELLAMFTDGPIHTSVDSMARRLRVALHLAGRMPPPARGRS